MYSAAYSNAPSAVRDENSPRFLHNHQHALYSNNSPMNAHRLSQIHYEQSFTHHHHLPSSAPAPLVLNAHATQPFQPPYPYQSPQPLQSAYPSLPAMPSRASLHPIPQSLLNDPAFSSDPRSNPHFVMNAAEQIMPFTTPTADLHNLSHRDSWYPPRQQDPASRVQNVVKPPRFSTPSHSPVNTPLSYLILANQTNTPFPTPHQHPSPHAFPNGIPNGQPFPPTHVLPPQMATQQYPVISPAVPYTGVYPGPDPSSSPYGTWAPPLITTSSSSSSSPWSQSGSIPPTPSTVASSLNSPAVTPTPLASANSSKTKLALVGSPPPSPPPPAYTPTPPEFSRPDLVNSTSAPDVRPPPPPVPVPTRSATAPVPEASSSRSASSSNGQQATDTVRRTRSKKNIVAAAPKDLDKIDELDESDPLGFAWHHGGPYEAIKRSAENGDIERDPKRDALTKMNGQDPTGQQRNRKVKKLTPADMARMLSHFKGVAPGEIFPSFTMYEPYDEPQPSSRFQPPVQPNQPLIRRFTQPEPQSSLSPSYGQDASLPNPYSPAALQTSFDPVPQVDEEDSELPYSQPPPLSNPYDNQPSRYSPQPPQDYSHRPQDVPAPGVVIPPPNGDSNGPVRVHFQEPTLHRPHEMTSGNSSIASSLGDPNRSLNRAHSAPTSRPAARYQQPISESSQQQPQQQQQQQQQIQYQNGIPRPDIPAPARSIMSTNTASSSNGGVPPRHYLPKKLVMPTPLQQQPIAPSNSQNVPSVGGGGPGPYPNPVVLGSGYQGPPKPDAATTVRRAVSASVPGSQKRAQEIPISQGKNLLRKKAGMSTVVASTNVSVKDKEKDKEKGKEKEKEKEREKQREKEREKEKKASKEREKVEKEREKSGRKLSKRR